MSGKKKGSSKGNVEAVVRKLIEPVADELNLEIWDVVFEKVGGNAFLRIFIDKEGGVTIEDCEAFSRAVDPLLDEADPISDSYCLEVSSPGMGRTLTKPFHFEILAGEKIMLTLYSPYKGSREVIGILKNYGSGDITIEIDGENVEFKKAQIAKSRLYDDELYQ